MWEPSFQFSWRFSFSGLIENRDETQSGYHQVSENRPTLVFVRGGSSACAFSWALGIPRAHVLRCPSLWRRTCAGTSPTTLYCPIFHVYEQECERTSHFVLDLIDKDRGPNRGPQWSHTHQCTIHTWCVLFLISCGWTLTELIFGFTSITNSVRSRSCKYR